MKRAYSMDAWRKDFAAAFASAVPMEAVSTQARGPLLASSNDEPEPRDFAVIEAEANTEARAIVRHSIRRESTGTGPGDSTTLHCACGKSFTAFEHQDDKCKRLADWERAHLSGSAA